MVEQRIGRMSIVVAAVMGGAMVLSVGSAIGMQLPRAQSEMAADLRSRDLQRIGRVLAEMAAVSPADWETELRGALLEALEREIEHGAFGEDPHVAVYPMFNLAMEVAGLGDARAAPVLARHGGFGWVQLDMLVSLGEPGLRAVLDFAPQTDPLAVDDGVGGNLDHQRVVAMLHLFVYEWGVEAFDAGTLDEIRRITERAMAGPSDPVVLIWGAMGLALLVGSQELHAAVEEMAVSDQAVRQRFFRSESWGDDYESIWIEQVRREAAYLIADPGRTPYFRRPGCSSENAFPKPPLCKVGR